MFQVFSVLFSVCSQFHRQSFHRVPCVLGFRRSRHEHRFLYSFLARRERWEQWELDSLRGTSASGAWNRRGTTGNKYRWSGNRSFKG
jgi:hypothetical protein